MLEPESGTFHPGRSVQRHPEMPAKLLLEKGQKFCPSLFKPGVVADFVIPQSSIVLQVVRLHPLHPRRVVFFAIFCNFIRIIPSALNQIARHQNEVRIFRLDRLQHIGQRILPPRLRISGVRVKKIRNTDEAPRAVFIRSSLGLQRCE